MLLNVPQFVFHTAMCERASFQYNKSIRQHIFTHCFSGWGVATGGGGDLFSQKVYRSSILRVNIVFLATDKQIF